MGISIKYEVHAFYWATSKVFIQQITKKKYANITTNKLVKKKTEKTNLSYKSELFDNSFFGKNSYIKENFYIYKIK